MKMVSVAGVNRSTFDRLVNQMDGFAEKYLEKHSNSRSFFNTDYI